MKLLIVDDEELTRTGVISSIDWKSLAIDEVIQADDGQSGLEAARIHKPEIILCDVRMPRMTGITMLSRIEEFLPDTVAIFMSGYSDKEYLMAAIRLKAINYIEKPLNPTEIYNAVAEARDTYLKKIHSQHGEALHSIETASRLALFLTAPYSSNAGSIQKLASELSLPFGSNVFFTAIVIHLATDTDLSLHPADEIHQDFKKLLKAYHLNCIYAEKHLQYLIYFLFGASEPSSSAWNHIQNFLHTSYSRYNKYYIAAGETVLGEAHAYTSYESAVILLQSSFFYPAGTFLTPEAPADPVSFSATAPFAQPEAVLETILSNMEEEKCDDFLNQLYAFYFRNRSILPNHAKDVYYKLFQTLESVSRQLQFHFDNENYENLLDTMDSSFSFQELHEKLADKLKTFFHSAASSVQENSTIFLIRDYISKNYMNETLSVRDISEHVFLSTSYVCTFFKNETGQTLNQYLTSYRMEKAKQLLADPRYKIADISSRVGYSDGNYFGKSFKKFTGYSPSEYRERLS